MPKAPSKSTAATTGVSPTTTEQTLPLQEQFFSTEKLKKSARAGTQLPNPTSAPFGYDAKAQFRHLFPALELPALFPPQRLHPEDHVSFGSPELKPHQLHLGDNLYVLRGMATESVDLIYIDPPFFSNRTYTQIWGDDNEIRSFNDIFQDGMFSYLAWMNARLWEMKRVLKSTGSIYLHCDWHASHYLKCEMDKVFGYDNMVNEIVWSYKFAGRSKASFPKKHDVIFWYRKSDKYIFNIDDPKVRVPITEDSVTHNYRYTDESGRKYREDPRKSGKTYRYYLDSGKLPESVWTDIDSLHFELSERLGYPTQKPEQLLERIIAASSNEGDVVADFFMGGGTTGAVALKLGRRFIGSDVSRVAVSVTSSRLTEIAEQLSGVDVVQKAQPSLTGTESSGMADIQIGYVGSYPQDKFVGIPQDQFIRFILELYGAHTFTGASKYIHGLANTKLVLSVGPGNPSERVTLTQVDGALKDTLRLYSPQLAAGEEKIIQLIGWSFDPQVEGWKGKAIKALNDKKVKLQIELISLSTETFRQKVFRNVGESNLDLKFNRLNQLLSFTGAPYAGVLQLASSQGREAQFVLQGARALGAGGKLINCQWDFEFDGQHFANRAYALNRNKVGTGDYEAVLDVDYTFAKDGEYQVAARVQDNLDGQATAILKVVVAGGKVSVVN
jgi:DNA modification methylase